MAVVRLGKLLGMKQISYTKKSTGEVKSGYELHFQYQDPDIQGVGCANFYVNASELTGKKLSSGDSIKVYDDTFAHHMAYIPD